MDTIYPVTPERTASSDSSPDRESLQNFFMEQAAAQSAAQTPCINCNVLKGRLSSAIQSAHHWKDKYEAALQWKNKYEAAQQLLAAYQELQDWLDYGPAENQMTPEHARANNDATATKKQAASAAAGTALMPQPPKSRPPAHLLVQAEDKLQRQRVAVAEAATKKYGRVAQAKSVRGKASKRVAEALDPQPSNSRGKSSKGIKGARHNGPKLLPPPPLNPNLIPLHSRGA